MTLPKEPTEPVVLERLRTHARYDNLGITVSGTEARLLLQYIDNNAAFQYNWGKHDALGCGCKSKKESE